MTMIIQSIELERNWQDDGPTYLRPYHASVTFADDDKSYLNIKVQLTPTQIQEVMDLMVDKALQNIATDVAHFTKPTVACGSDGRNHTEEHEAEQAELARVSQVFDETAATIADDANVVPLS